MSPQSRSATELHAEQVTFWRGDGGDIWLRAATRIEPGIAPLGARVMAAAAARPGETVIDIGCGLGTTTRALARAVAPSGQALGLDLSAVMMAEAARRAAAEGLANLSFVAGDASTHEFAPASADLLFSRFGVMFFGDPPAVFAHLRTALKPGGRLAFLCWRPFKENGWALVPFMAGAPLLPPLPRPAPDEPGPFAFADPARVTGILAAAGYSEIAIDAIDDTIALSSGGLDEAVTQATELGPLSRALRGASPELRVTVMAAVRSALSAHLTADGVRLPAACWQVQAINPG